MIDWLWYSLWSVLLGYLNETIFDDSYDASTEFKAVFLDPLWSLNILTDFLAYLSFYLMRLFKRCWYWAYSHYLFNLSLSFFNFYFAYLTLAAFSLDLPFSVRNYWMWGVSYLFFSSKNIIDCLILAFSYYFTWYCLSMSYPYPFTNS